MKIAKFLGAIFEELKQLKGKLLESKENKRSGMVDYFCHQIHPYASVKSKFEISLSTLERITHRERIKQLDNIINDLRTMREDVFREFKDKKSKIGVPEILTNNKSSEKIPYVVRYIESKDRPCGVKDKSDSCQFNPEGKAFGCKRVTCKCDEEIYGHKCKECEHSDADNWCTLKECIYGYEAK